MQKSSFAISGVIHLVPDGHLRCFMLSVLSASMCGQVRKSYEEKRKRRRARGQKRPWRLKRMAMELEDEAGGAPGRGREQRGGPRGTRREQDMERFMQACLLPHDLYITAARPMYVTDACHCSVLGEAALPLAS